MSKKEKQIEDMVLPDFVSKIPNGLFKINLSDLKTQARVFMLNNKENLTFEGFVQTLIDSKESFKVKTKKGKRCKKCKGSIFVRGKETEIGVFVFVDWKCINCGNIEPSRVFSEAFKRDLKNKEKEIDTDIVTTIDQKSKKE